MSYVLLYLGSAIAFLVIDLIWLGVIAKNLYRDKLGHLLADDFNKAAAAVFYLLFILGTLIFAVLPALREGDFSKAIIYGALFGFFTYATYDLTNLATLKNWPLSITIYDLIWGSFITATVAGVGYAIGSRLGL